MKLTDDSMERLERRAKVLLEKGYEVEKSLYVTFWTSKYAIKFSNKPNKDSSYLKMKRSFEKLQETIKEFGEIEK